jgi:hypothetical protein
MASYASYKKIVNDNLVTGAVQQDDLASTALATWNAKWFYGQPCACSTGCCCLWTVPAGVRSMYIEAWGAGGSGSGACDCNRCQHYQGAGGGYYAAKYIITSPGCQYTVCAAGNGNCCRQECSGCFGCTSYVNGFNLSNFCAIGGIPACANTDWSVGCFSEFGCCVGPTANGADFTMGNHRGNFRGGLAICHCWCKSNQATGAPFIGADMDQGLTCCTIRCGCWTVPYGAGGQSAMVTFCAQNATGQGGMGGPGLVKITYF